MWALCCEATTRPRLDSQLSGQNHKCAKPYGNVWEHGEPAAAIFGLTETPNPPSDFQHLCISATDNNDQDWTWSFEHSFRVFFSLSFLMMLLTENSDLVAETHIAQNAFCIVFGLQCFFSNPKMSRRVFLSPVGEYDSVKVIKANWCRLTYGKQLTFRQDRNDIPVCLVQVREGYVPALIAARPGCCSCFFLDLWDNWAGTARLKTSPLLSEGLVVSCHWSVQIAWKMSMKRIS